MVKLLAFLLAPLCLSANLLISGNGPMGIMADARINIPLDPHNDPIAPMRDSSDRSWSGTVTVFGGTGDGYLYFAMETFAESFSGSPSSEYMDSYASITSSAGSVSSQPWLRQGSTPADCQFCAIKFTFGIPQQVVFSAHAYVSYDFYPMVPGVPPYLAGATIRSSASVGVKDVAIVGPAPYFPPIFGPQGNYSVVFGLIDPDPVPEGNSEWLAAGGLVAMGLWRRRWRVWPLHVC